MLTSVTKSHSVSGGFRPVLGIRGHMCSLQLYRRMRQTCRTCTAQRYSVRVVVSYGLIQLQTTPRRPEGAWRATCGVRARDARHVTHAAPTARRLAHERGRMGGTQARSQPLGSGEVGAPAVLPAHQTTWRLSLAARLPAAREARAQHSCKGSPQRARKRTDWRRQRRGRGVRVAVLAVTG